MKKKTTKRESKSVIGSWNQWGHESTHKAKPIAKSVNIEKKNILREPGAGLNKDYFYTRQYSYVYIYKYRQQFRLR